MKTSFSKKSFFILTIVWVIITFNLIKTTYAKYVTNLDASTNVSISCWNISVNTTDILENSDISNVLTLNLLENQYAKNDVIVPGSVAYFDLNINSANSNVGFTVTVTPTINENSTLSEDFVVLGYSIDGADTITKLSDDNASSFSHTVSKETTSSLIRVYITWEDDGTDSIEDTNLGILGGNLITDVYLKFEQLTDTTTT